MVTQIARRTPPAGARTYKLSDPLPMQLHSIERLSAPGSDDILHLRLARNGQPYEFAEGQSLGVITPGTREDGKAHKLRLYSIASGQAGDGDPDLIGLCVKRVVEERPEGVYHGVCSNYLCNLKPGETLQATGPVGKAFALPEDSSLGVVMFATGTGIAPFRAFLQAMYPEQGESWRGPAALFYGARTRGELAYLNDQNDDLAALARRGHLPVHTALSREERTASGQRLYVQHRLLQEAHDIWPMVRDGRSVVYICGIKGMDHGIAEAFGEMARSDGRDWEQLLADWKRQGLWNVEVY